MPVVNVPAKYETSANSGPQPTWGGARLATTANTFVNYNFPVPVTSLINGIGIARETQRVGIDYYTYRTFLFFDNFGIPSGSTINSITLNVYNSTNSGGFAVSVARSFAFGIDGSSNFVASDYNNWLDTNIFPPTPHAQYGQYRGWLINNYNSTQLNSTAIIDATIDGYLNLVLLNLDHDWLGNAPTIDKYDYDGVTYRGASPNELVIDYTPPGSIIKVINSTGNIDVVNSALYYDISKINDGDTGY